MKTRTVAWVACAAMIASCALVYTLTPAGGARLEKDGPTEVVAVAADSPARFTGESTLKVDARLGYAALPRAGTRENLLYVRVAADEDAGAKGRVMTSTALVIDRSGSMVGGRLTQAIAAAQQWVRQLRDGDRVSVVAFSNTAQMVVPTTTLTSDSRPGVIAALARLTTGGNTCLSCGVSLAGDMLANETALRRMIVLSDGHANFGAKTVPELSQLARTSRARDTSIVTLGIGEDYSESALATLAFETNGRHHFVESLSALSGIFTTEANELASTVATEGEVTITLGDDVELVRVFDRAHRKDDGVLVVPLGAFSPGQEKTVLAEVRVRGDAAKRRHVAEVHVRFRDAGAQQTSMRGVLEVEMAERRSAMDPMVAVRLAKGQNADALEEAASLFEQGNKQEALELLDAHNARLAAQAAAAPEPAASALSSAIATASAARARISAAPTAAARREVLRSKVSSTSARE